VLVVGAVGVFVLTALMTFAPVGRGGAQAKPIVAAAMPVETAEAAQANVRSTAPSMDASPLARH
jgi:hypothetical protein